MPLVSPIVNVEVPTVVGVPTIEVMTPVKTERFRPVGKLPETLLQVNGPVAVPFAFSVESYVEPVVPFDNVVGVI